MVSLVRRRIVCSVALQVTIRRHQDLLAASV